MSTKPFPNMAQVVAARDALTDFLVHGQHFCPFVDACEYVCRLERFGLIHYVFRFCVKGSPWMVAVSGGFSSEEDREPDTYIGTDGTPYREETAEQAAEALLDRMHFFAENGELEKLIPDADQVLTPEEMDRTVEKLREALRRVGVEVDAAQMRQMMELDQAEVRSRMDGAGEETDEEPATISQTVLTAEPVTDMKLLADAIAGASFRTATYETEKDVVILHYGEADVTVTALSAVSDADIETAAARTPGSEDVPKNFHSYTGALSVQATSRTLWESDLGYFLVHVVAAVLERIKAVGVLTAGALLSPEAYRRSLTDAFYTRGFPIELFVCVSEETDEDGTPLLVTHGMEEMGDAELFCLKPDKEEVAEASSDLLDIAYDLLMNEALTAPLGDPEEEYYLGRGGSGYMYALYPEQSDGPEGSVPDAWWVERTLYAWMDDAGRITDNLRMIAPDGMPAENMMNRMGYFLLWAHARKFWRKFFENEIDHRMTEPRFAGDIRRLLLELAEALDTRIFTEEAQRFVEDYYSMRHPEEGFYADLRDYTLAHTYAPQDVIRMQSAGCEAPAFGEWSEKVFKDVSALLDKRFAEWKGKKEGRG